jgi:Tfp pilus assembly protein PilN
MVQDINLLPQNVLNEQYEKKAVKVSTIVTIVLVVLVAAFSGFLYYQKLQMEKLKTSLDGDVEKLRLEIKSLASTEIKIRNLDKKYTALNSVFSKQYKFSKLMQELRIRKPEGVSFNSVDVKVGKLNISGFADNYVSIAQFVNNLLNKKFVGGVGGLESLFTGVTLNSISLDNARNMNQFFIVVDFDQEKLK